MARSIARSELSTTRTVCIGGGTGVPSSIRALTMLGIDPDTVVSVADDGGSSGLLRTHTGQVPPGDLRKCLIALARDQQNPWVKAFRKRFEYANDHALGNLILTALQETTGSLAQSIALCEELLQTRGHVYPASFESVLLMGITRDGQRIAGQSTLSKSETALAEVALSPAQPAANEEAMQAIEEAELLVFGPGSLFTSIIPNLLIPGIREAIHVSRGATVFILPVADVQGETWGLNAAELVEALEKHGLAGRLDYVLANKHNELKQNGNVTGYFSAIDSSVVDKELTEQSSSALRPLVMDDEITKGIRKRGIKVLTRAMSDAQQPSWHNPEELAKALASVIADAKGL